MVNFVLKPPLLTDQTPFQLNPTRPWNQIGSIAEGRRLRVPTAWTPPELRPQLTGQAPVTQYSPKVVNVSTTGQATVNPLTQFVPGGEAQKYMSSITEFRDRPTVVTGAEKKVPDPLAKLYREGKGAAGTQYQGSEVASKELTPESKKLIRDKWRNIKGRRATEPKLATGKTNYPKMAAEVRAHFSKFVGPRQPPPYIAAMAAEGGKTRMSAAERASQARRAKALSGRRLHTSQQSKLNIPRTLSGQLGRLFVGSGGGSDSPGHIFDRTMPKLYKPPRKLQ